MERAFPETLKHSALTPVCRAIFGLLSRSSSFPASSLRILSASEWQLFLETCRRQAVAPLIWQNIVEQELEPAIPGSVLAGLKHSYLASEARNAFHFSKLDSIIGALGRAGIPVALLKGAHIGRYVYRNPALRPMADIDLLVRPECVDRALQVLHDLGYGSGRPAPYRLMRDFHHHAPTLDDGSGICVELHWQIIHGTASFLLSPEDLWQDAQPVDRNGSAGAFLLAPETLLLAVCVHALWQHRLSHNSMLALADLDGIVRDIHRGFDWAALTRKSTAWNMRRPAYLGLRLIRQLLGTPVPEKILTLLGPEEDADHLQDLTIGMLCAPPSRVSMPRRAPEMLSPGSLPVAARYLARVFFPGRVSMLYFYGVEPTYANLLKWYRKWLQDHLAYYGKTLWNLARKDAPSVHALRAARSQQALSAWLTHK